jgi:hypothetical protein
VPRSRRPARKLDAGTCCALCRRATESMGLPSGDLSTAKKHICIRAYAQGVRRCNPPLRAAGLCTTLQGGLEPARYHGETPDCSSIVPRLLRGFSAGMERGTRMRVWILPECLLYSSCSPGPFSTPNAGISWLGWRRQREVASLENWFGIRLNTAIIARTGQFRAYGAAKSGRGQQRN